MPRLFIRATDSRFHSSDEGAEYDLPEAALALGIQGAVAILSDEIKQGERNAAVEVSIEAEDGTQVLRSIVAISVSSLIPRSRAARLATTY
jgi:hypothetical protein